MSLSSSFLAEIKSSDHCLQLRRQMIPIRLKNYSDDFEGVELSGWAVDDFVDCAATADSSSLSREEKFSGGNENLCGPPLNNPCPSAPASTSTPAPAPASKLPNVKIVVIVVCVVALLAITAATIIIMRKRSGQTPQTLGAPPHGHKKAASNDLDRAEQGNASPAHSAAGSRKGENMGRLTFLRDDVEKFDLPDLLKASAEVLGSGYFGSSYKAALMTGKMMVVKRFRHMNNVGKEEFQEHMRRLGRLRHNNLLPVVAFYYRKEEKLLVSEYVDNVSLAIHLHGNRSRGQPCPDWPTRLKIIKGVAKGLLYLYNELPSLIVPHGHLKSSNVLLNESYEPLLTDYALVPVVNQEHAQDVLVGYKSPEYKLNNRVTKKTDVWSFGILILEILTGKFPANILQQGKGSDMDLLSWVESVLVSEDSREGVFDKDMGVVKNCEGEMMKLLKIGMCCAESDVEKRLDMKEAVERIQEVKEKDNDEEFYSSYTSEGDVKSARGLSDDLSYSINV
ncbi:hypothetical protein Vadar_017517 [Vaccinium darrowii]|uniref:Uncharacterized protein n=1 Tax=Vaccinium darrowii TaxID=229202 RepID=A0ACB7Y806_9ERIC|nr:hypothetical protein Vadar_017517 [Vaccinium darrowii]